MTLEPSPTDDDDSSQSDDRPVLSCRAGGRSCRWPLRPLRLPVAFLLLVVIQFNSLLLGERRRRRRHRRPSVRQPDSLQSVSRRVGLFICQFPFVRTSHFGEYLKRNLILEPRLQIIQSLLLF